MNQPSFASTSDLTNPENKPKYFPIVPLEKVEANEHYRSASMVFKNPGLYKVIFDNSYSLLRSKDIYYSIHLLSKSEELIL